MSEEEFNKLWKNSTKEQILNQYYYDYEEMIKSHNTIKEVREYIEENYPTSTINYQDDKHKLLEILDKENNET